MQNKELQPIFDQLTTEYNLPRGLLRTITRIEQAARPRYARIAEYSVLFLAFVRNKVFRVPIKNYTLGKCQLGISTILNYYNYGLYQHLKHIQTLSIKQILIIYSSAMSVKQYCILAKHLAPINERACNIYPDSSNENDLASRYIYIGEEFNGRYSYGLRLAELMRENAIDYKE